MTHHARFPVGRSGGVEARFVDGPRRGGWDESVATAIREVWDDDTYQIRGYPMRGKRVIDIGANCGAFSVLAALLGAESVVAYEPHPVSVELLRANVELNGVADVVAVVEAAVDPTAATIHVDGISGGVHRSETGTEVVTVHPDAALAVHDHVDFLKMDCEGCEYDFVAAVDSDTLLRVDTLRMEFHGPRMPHLGHLRGAAQFGPLVARLADYGEIWSKGHPVAGGLLHWERYR